MTLEDYIELFQLIQEVERVRFSNWVMPDDNQLRLEYKIEHQLKNRNFFYNEEEFLNKVKNESDIIEVDKNFDQNIDNRSRTTSREELLSLIRTYRSYPEFRNEETVDEIYKGFKNNKPMDYPIVIHFIDDDYYFIFSGNTRMDVAFQLGINPEVLIVPVS